MSVSPQLCSSLRPPYSRSLSAVQAHNKWTQPCVTLNVPIYTNAHSDRSGSPSMCPLFCSGAGMCGAGWRHHTGQLTTYSYAWGAGVIGPDHKETSSPRACALLLLPPLPTHTHSHLGTMDWSDFTVTKSSVSFSSSRALYNNQDLLHSHSKSTEERLYLLTQKLLFGYLTPLTFRTKEQYSDSFPKHIWTESLFIIVVFPC